MYHHTQPLIANLLHTKKTLLVALSILAGIKGREEDLIELDRLYGLAIPNMVESLKDTNSQKNSCWDTSALYN
jgi:regulator of sigma D